ncbi:MAG: hypothetical protein ACJ79K_06845 [Gemmatimonadaceae bacterium]
MSDRPQWLRADLLVAAAVVGVIVVAALSPRWRSGRTGPIGNAGSSSDVAAGVDASGRPTLPPPPSRKHRSPFNDEVTARAESLCVVVARSQIGFALKEPVVPEVTDRYGIGNEDDGRGVWLYFDGMARTSSGRLSAFRCRMESYGSYAGDPQITHVEAP